jgi:hypothetical protein
MAVFIIRARYGPRADFLYEAYSPAFKDVPRTHDFFKWIQKMQALGITSGCSATTYCPDDPVTRGQLAVFVMRGAFNQLLPDSTAVVQSISSTMVNVLQTTDVTIRGLHTNFSSSSRLAVEGIIVTNMQVLDWRTIKAQFTAPPGTTPGRRSVTVVTGNEEATLPNSFLVQ